MSTSSTAAPAPAAAAAVTSTTDAFAPSPFHGLPQENAENWLSYFTKYSDFKSLTADAKLKFVKILMRDGACDWYDSLPAESKASFDAFADAFKTRFAPSDLTRWTEVNEVLTRKQAEGESVDEYIMTMTRFAKRVPIPDGAMLRYTIIKGLLPSVRAHVLQQNVKSMSELIHAARVAELSAPENRDATMSILVKKVDALSHQLGGMAVTSMETGGGQNQRSTSSPRRVTFTTQPQQRRSDSPRRWGNHQGSHQSRVNNGRQQPGYSCGRCGKQHFNSACPAFNLNCYKCGRQGHLGRMCRNGRRTITSQSE